MLYFLVQKAHRFGEWHNKRFKRDSQRVAFLLCVVFCDYDVMRKVSRSVVCPLS
ncbi:DUF3265 domain-containing protein, partial [Vibrio cholerae]|nr:DUF3265 domain-containing protein [Vibrio cholerae]